MTRLTDDAHAVPVTYLLLVFAVQDVARARAFYDAAFGWEVAVALPVFVEYRIGPGLGLGLYAREGYARNTGAMPCVTPPGAISAAEVYLRVDDLEAAVLRLERAGARVLSPISTRPWGDEAAYFADPDGNVVTVARCGPAHDA